MEEDTIASGEWTPSSAIAEEGEAHIVATGYFGMECSLLIKTRQGQIMWKFSKAGSEALVE